MVTVQRRERVVQRLIEEEMRESFLDYSMSVIVQRALPDVRDGLKPVHRRILYAMRELGLNPNRPYKKSASVVGEVLGKYHPHGDTAVYDTMVRMVQDFSLRYPLIDGQGNFGSIDGDNAAAYRYTEAKLAAVALELLADIDRDTVGFIDTFDAQRQEPMVLPARLPNLLVNGSSGIAVGMSTNVPPHNLSEIAKAVKLLVRNPDVTVKQLMKVVPGPDFPTGGLIMGTDGIRAAYTTGRGRIVMRARVVRETKRGGKEQIVVTELPYGVSKARVIEQIAELARHRTVDDISDLRDESDRDGMRIVIELKRGAQMKPVLNKLWKKTHLQSTFGAIMLALDHGTPREFTLKELLERYRDHRLDVIRRRSEHDLREAREEAHIVEGLITALDYIDEIIGVIRKSKNRDEAAAALRKRFDFSEAQANAILDMRLARLTSLETDELKKRQKELKALIKELTGLLADEQLQLAKLVDELDEVVAKFADARRTAIMGEETEVAVEDMIAQEDVVVTVSHEGYIKRIPMYLYRRRATSGKPLAGMERYEGDFLEHAFIANTHDTVLLFTTDGHAYALPVHEVPESARASRGKSLSQLLGLERDAALAAVVTVGDFDADRVVVFLTSDGTIKRTTLDQFANTRAGGINAINLKAGDSLLDVKLSDGGNDIVLVTRAGRAIRFPETDAPAMGRAAQGVRGIKLRPKDTVVGMVVVRRDSTLCTITAQGYAKRTPITEYPVQGRGGLGTLTLKTTDRTGTIVAAKELIAGDELMLITAKGIAGRLRADDVPVQGRSTQGKHVLALARGDKVVEVARIGGGGGGGGASEVDEDELGVPAGQEELEL
ncbi:MAG TPA: DNA gyrase subunit A [Longimicrobiales bacterium]|nr:DNA gyrase subunit A [Longimicrobiales bacterium]